jgi:formylglycine-generating enzyme required for sulfatase activity/uncharacterized caspase-like protein
MVEKSPLENAFALIIGISNYKDPNIRKLNYTRADAEGINKILSDPKKVGLNPEKIKILLDENATLFNIKNAITDWLYKNANKDSYVLIYFAGHGGLEEDKLGTEADNWAKYLLPFDTVKDNLYASALSNREFHDLLRSIKSRKLVIFMDSCYSGGVSGGKARDVDVKITDDPYKKLAEGEGRLVIAASQPNQQSFENDGLGHGVFTYHLIEALSGAADFDKDGVVTAMEVYQYLSENVPKTVKRLEGREQVPLVRAELKTDFVVAVNNERIYEVDCEKIKKEKLDRLWDLYNKKELSPEQYELACKVVESICEDLSEDELKVLKLVNDLLDNKIKNISRFRSDLDRFIGKERQTGIIKSEAGKATEGKIKKQEEIDIERKNKNRLQGKTETLQKEEGEIKKKEREEQKQITREGEKKTSEDGKKPSNNRLFAVLLMLFLLVLGYWGLAPGGNESIVSQASDQKAITNSIGMDLVLIPSGEFDMGSPTNEKDRFSYENPVHHVNISNAFYLGKYEVTQKQWRDVMGRSPSGFKGDNRPVEQVSWYDVQDFIKKLNEKEGVNKYRLPSEAEWEYADRAGTTTRYFFGDDESKLSEFAWYDSNSETVTHDVGQKKPNPWGLYDMNGNVMEWVQDKWHTDYYGAPTDGSSWESGDSSDRIYRGGDWINNARICRSAERIWSDPGNRGGSLGFRLLRVL